MQTSFHREALDVLRAPDVSGPSSEARHYSASEESLEALKTRTTPKDITNPYTSSHASCANAFIATAISIEHRYDEMHLQLPCSCRFLKKHGLTRKRRWLSRQWRSRQQASRSQSCT